MNTTCTKLDAGGGVTHTTFLLGALSARLVRANPCSLFVAGRGCEGENGSVWFKPCQQMLTDNKKLGISKQNYLGVGEYYGYWENGEHHGECVLPYVNQDIYSGNCNCGKKRTPGYLRLFKTGEKYVGRLSGYQPSVRNLSE